MIVAGTVPKDRTMGAGRHGRERSAESSAARDGTQRQAELEASPTSRENPRVLDWNALAWPEFVEALEAYRRDYYLGRSPREEERAYIEIAQTFQGMPLAERACHTAELVLFLNRWKCHLATEPSRAALSEWIQTNCRSLEGLENRRLLDPEVTALTGVIDRLYESLISLKTTAIPTMGDAAASKILHQMVPGLFVMWDKYVRQWAPGYGAYTVSMHELASRLVDQAPDAARADIEGYLQRRLSYPIRKSLAKYVDEYNWYVAFGKSRIVALEARPRRSKSELEAEPTTSSSWDDEARARAIGEIAQLHDRLERDLRTVVRGRLQALEGGWREKLLKALNQRRREDLADKPGHALMSSLYFLELRDVISKYWPEFQNRFQDKQRFQQAMTTVNERPHAHAKEFDLADLALLRRDYRWLQERVDA